MRSSSAWRFPARLALGCSVLLSPAAVSSRAQVQDGQAFRHGGLALGPRALPPAAATPAASAAPASALPATPPTSLPAANSLPAPLAATPVSAPVGRARRAQVFYADGLLDVRANNSSLNQILHEISRRTGMSITGGVADQRVFGDYGPAAPSEVLATLLDGTGTNMLLRETDAHAPVELVLSPRGGGATPPNPNAQSYDDIEDPGEAAAGPSPSAPATRAAEQTTAAPPRTPAAALPPSMPQPLNNPLGSPNNTSPTASTLPVTHSVPLDTLPTPATATPPPQGIVDAPNPPAPGSTTSSTPNGVATPEQIYQQLLKLQQQQTQASPTTPTPPAPTPTPQANAPGAPK